MNSEKLSLDACTHAAQNDRLPLRTVIQVFSYPNIPNNVTFRKNYRKFRVTLINILSKERVIFI